MSNDLTDFLQQLWQYKPGMVILLVLAAVMFTLLVIDTHHYRKQREQRHRFTRLH